jgi:lysophospholipase L1-like esterase
MKSWFPKWGLARLSENRERVFDVKMNPALENADGSARAEWSVEDGPHLNPDGYRAFACVLLPAIEQHWKREG